MKTESYNPEEIFQAGFLVLQEDGKIFLDNLIMKLKKMKEQSSHKGDEKE